MEVSLVMMTYVPVYRRQIVPIHSEIVILKRTGVLIVHQMLSVVQYLIMDYVLIKIVEAKGR